MSVVSPTWLSLSGEANYLRSTYIDGFLDVSSSRGVLLRSDVSFGGNVVLSTSNFTGTVTPNSTAATSATWVNNGITWTSSASSVYDGNYSIHGAFNTVLADPRWSTVALYTGANSSYAGSVNTTVYTTGSSGTTSTYSGEWLQIQSSIPVVMKDFKLASATTDRFVKSFYIVGSTSGSGTWTPILYGSFSAFPANSYTFSGTITIPSGTASSQPMTVTNGTTSVTLTYSTYGNSGTAFSYFRMIALTSISVSIIDIAEWNINFSPATSAITLAPSTTTYGQLNLTGGLTTTGSVGIGNNLLIVSELGSGTLNPMSVAGDAGIFATGPARGSSMGLVLSNWNSSSSGIRIAPNGNVGIGTTNPASTLHVAGNAVVKGSLNIHTANTGGMDGAISLNNTSRDTMGIISTNYTSNGLMIGSWNNEGSFSKSLLLNMLGGSVGIGTTNPQTTLDVNGSIRAALRSTFGAGISLPVGALIFDVTNNGSALTIYRSDGVGVFLSSGSTGWSGNSDIRLKTNITNVPLCLNKINNLRPVFYNWNSSPNERQNVGFIAQEVEEIFPELISEIHNESLNDNAKALSMTDFIPYMVKGMQEQQVLIQSQQTQIDGLVARLAAAGIA